MGLRHLERGPFVLCCISILVHVLLRNVYLIQWTWIRDQEEEKYEMGLLTLSSPIVEWNLDSCLETTGTWFQNALVPLLLSLFLWFGLWKERSASMQRLLRLATDGTVLLVILLHLTSMVYWSHACIVQIYQEVIVVETLHLRWAYWTGFGLLIGQVSYSLVRLIGSLVKVLNAEDEDDEEEEDGQAADVVSLVQEAPLVEGDDDAT